MQPAHYSSPASLAPFIAFYGILEVAEGYEEPFVSPPLGLSGMILCLEGGSDARLNGNIFLKDPYSFTGQVTTPMTGNFSGPMKQLLVFVHPCGLYQLFGIDMSILTNTSIPVSKLLGSEECNTLIARLNNSQSHEEMIEVMNQFFLAQQPVFEIAPKVNDAINYIHLCKGSVTIRDIERYCFITSRSLERHFKIYIGLSPKEYAKIYQFKCLISFIRENPGLTWEKLCEQNGYYDQSHLTRYFDRYMQMKPQNLVHVDMEFINYLLQH